MRTYHFISTWKLEAALKDVWDAIYKSDDWPQWWKFVERVTEMQKGDENNIGTIKEYVWGTQFFYSIKFQSKLVENEYCKRLKGIAWGDLDGEGLWTFEEKNGVTAATYYWDVKTTKSWMNVMFPVLKPLFNMNHNIVMRAGAEGLARKLNAKLLG